jgi:DNA-binding SARP family transcriptional activator
MREMNEVNALMNMYMKTGETDKAMKVYNKNKDLIAWRSTYVKTNTQITKINRQIKLIEAQKNISERERYEKVKQLNLLKAQIVRTLKENVLAYEKSNDTRVKRPLWWK